MMYHIIVNPASKSGRGAKIWALIEPVLQQKNIPFKVYFSDKAGHVIEIVRTLSVTVLPSSNEDLQLIVLGGDGTFNEARQAPPDF